MKLEVKHVVPYLQHKVLLSYKNLEGKNIKAYLSGATTLDIETTYKRKIKGCSGDLIGWVGHNNVSDLGVKLALRSLSGLTKEIEHNGKKFIPYTELYKIKKDVEVYKPINFDYRIELLINTEDYSQEIDLYDGYLIIQKLLEWHFDVFGLIEKGLAIDINTL